MSHMRSMAAVAAVAVLFVLLFSSGETTNADNGLEARVAELTGRVASLEKELSTLQKQVLSNHPDPRTEQAAAAALQAINTAVARGDMAAAKPMLDELLQNYGNTRAAQQAGGLQRELGVVGKPAPEEWAIERWYQGENDIDLDADGPTILVFWETWCPHCRREVPKLQKLYDDHRDRGLQILGLSQLTRSATDESVRKFIEEHDLGFPFAKEDGQLAGHFGVAGIPAVAVVKDRTIVWRGHPARLTPSVIDTWLQ